MAFGLFFADDGSPLEARFERPNRRGPFTVSGTYKLQRALSGRWLQERLDQVKVVECDERDHHRRAGRNVEGQSGEAEASVSKLIVAEHLSLDGVMQAPGGPEEDPSGGFRLGGWTVPYADEAIGPYLKDLFSQPFELLLGRRTYEIWAAYWPKGTGGFRQPRHRRPVQWRAQACGHASIR
jgi:hypothetical protein